MTKSKYSDKYHFLALTLIIISFLSFQKTFSQAAYNESEKRPNFLWILSEDNSKHFLKLFDKDGAETPNIQSLADNGIIFNNAYSCSPVCSVARTTLMTSVYAPRLGTHFHRKIKPVIQPDQWELFPSFLRKAGYYTTNNSKKDYNLIEKGQAWDVSSRKAHWKNRKHKGQPFFHMQTFATSHESSLHFSQKNMNENKTKTDPENVFVPPMHPKTKIFKYTYARYHDRIKIIDGLVGKVVSELEEADLLEDTFIFYFGDHGGVLPGSKGYINERGVHIPLVVRIPNNFKHLVNQKVNSSIDGMVSFIDFGPTLLHLAGLSIPEFCDGKAFMGRGIKSRQINRRNTAFSHADRFDEKYDMVRSIRVGKWKYVRNFQSYYPDGLQNNYRYKMLAFKEWRELFHANKLDNVEARFFIPKPKEMLFDLSNDPYEIKNLASLDSNGPKLREMRRELNNVMASINDLSLFPESYLVANALENPIQFGEANAFKIKKLLSVANLPQRPFHKAKNQLYNNLKSKDAHFRYWAISACSEFGMDAIEFSALIKGLTKDPDLLVRMKASEFLAITTGEDPKDVIQEILKESESPTLNLIVLNSVVFLRDHLGIQGWNISEKTVPARNPEVSRRLEYLK